MSLHLIRIHSNVSKPYEQRDIWNVAWNLYDKFTIIQRPKINLSFQEDGPPRGIPPPDYDNNQDEQQQPVRIPGSRNESIVFLACCEQTTMTDGDS